MQKKERWFLRTIPEWFRGEQEKLAGYTLQDKLRYIWQYYRIPILLLLFIGSFAGYAIHQYVTVPGDIHFYGIFSNTYAPLGEGSAFYRDFVTMADYDLSQGVIEFDCANYCKPSGRVIGNTYYEKLISMLDSGTDDIWVAEGEDVIAIGEAGRLLDLNSDAASEIRALYADRFVYCQPLRESYSTEPVPIGIDLSGTVLTGEYSAYPNGAVLGINAYTKRLDQVLVFLRYLFQDSQS